MKGKKSLCGELLMSKLCCYCFSPKRCNFKMVVIKWQLNFVSCNFGLKSHLISNQTRATRKFDFEITRMISDQIILHSVQLLLLIYNGTEWSPIRSAIIRVINKIERPRSGSPIC